MPEEVNTVGEICRHRRAEHCFPPARLGHVGLLEAGVNHERPGEVFALEALAVKDAAPDQEAHRGDGSERFCLRLGESASSPTRSLHAPEVKDLVRHGVRLRGVGDARKILDATRSVRRSRGNRNEFCFVDAPGQ